MKQIFTFKSVLIALLAMISCTMKAEIVEYKTNGGFAYSLDTETQEASLAKYRGEATDVIIPESVIYEGKEYKVTSLGDYCFEWCSSLTSIEIPASVTNLGEACFSYCSSLTSIVVDSNNLKYDSREGCNAIIETESNMMITGCKSTRIPESVTSLGNYCFFGCSFLTSIEIPSSVTSLGDYCFFGCSFLTSMVIPSSVTSFGDCCFYLCSSLTSIEIPSSVTSFGEFCFYNCSSLTSIEIPSSVTSLGRSCFSRCSSLTSIEIPSSVTSLGQGCFEDCSSLTSVEISLSVTSLGWSCFQDCSSLTSIEIPSSVTSLGQNCFQGCSSLTSIEIPSSVTGLGNCCFYGCSSLTSIEIPSSVTGLGSFCFGNCNSLKIVICKTDKVITQNSTGFTVFYNVPIEDATLYVPEELLDAYKSTDPWKDFGTILPLTDEQVSVDDISELSIALNTNNGNVVVSGLADGTQVSCYTVDGRMLGKASANGGTASFATEPNSIVIVKVGKKTFKVYVK